MRSGHDTAVIYVKQVHEMLCRAAVVIKLRNQRIILNRNVVHKTEVKKKIFDLSGLFESTSPGF